MSTRKNKMASKKKIKTTTGTNIRFSDIGYKIVKSFCDENSLKLGAFCEKAVVEKVKHLELQTLDQKNVNHATSIN